MIRTDLQLISATEYCGLGKIRPNLYVTIKLMPKKLRMIRTWQRFFPIMLRTKLFTLQSFFNFFVNFKNTIPQSAGWALS